MKAAAPPALNTLRAFEAFARHGSMTLAANELCVTHGAVSRQVRVLQDTLGIRLVNGPRHRLELTQAGQALARRLSTGFTEIDQAVRDVRQADHRALEISCLGTFALKWLIPRLTTFLSAHPDIPVQISESYAPVDFRRDRFDGAIRVLDRQQTVKGTEVTPFMPLYQGPVSAPGVAGTWISLADFARLPRLHSATFRESWSVWSQLAGVSLSPATVEREFAHNHSMLEAAAAGLGVAVVPWAFVAPDIASGRLVAPFGFEEQTSHFAFLRPQGRKNSAVDTFRDWLVREGATSPLPARGERGVA